MSIDDFSKSLRNVHDKRTHKITNSLTTRAIYRRIYKGVCPNRVDITIYQKIIKCANAVLAEILSKEGYLRLPYGMGILEVQRVKTIPFFKGKDKKILIPNKIKDWKKTIELWYNDEQAFNDKIVIYKNNQFKHRIKYYKKGCNLKNRNYWLFRPNRTLKNLVFESAEKQIL